MSRFNARPSRAPGRTRRPFAAAATIGLLASPLAILTATAPAANAATPVDIQILATNDFHGRIKANGAEAGAAKMAGVVKQLRTDNPNTVFTAAGDLIGASTFESFIAEDKPTIDSLNEAGLEVSSVGNHEFDKGYDDLVNRVMAPYDAETNPHGGAEWEYLAANVEKAGVPAEDQLAKSWTKEMDGVQVGFVGAVTEHLPELVAPGGMEGVTVSDIVTAVNTEADELKAGGADLVVMLVHEGAPSTDCATMDDDPASDFGSIVTGVNPNVDAIVSGHTHLAYDCKFPVTEWANRPVTERPVVSAGQYGTNLNQLNYTVDSETGDVTGLTTSVIAIAGQPAAEDPATKTIVDAAVAEADVLGAKELGKIGAGLYRAKLADGATENRGGESTLGNMVAEAQRWQTGADVAFMNPGGLRADMTGNPGEFPRVLTYKQAAAVQPFANTLTTMTMTGAQLETVLEEQWQPAGASRPFLRLGASKGFTYTYDPPAADAPSGTKGEVTGMWLDGTPITDAATFKVSVNSFLSTGGDNFTTFKNGTNRADSGKTDLEGMVDYMAEFGSDEPLSVDYSQRAVGLEFPTGAPATYAAGDTLAFDVSSWSMTGADDKKDQQLRVRAGRPSLGNFAVDNTVQAALPGFDVTGSSDVSLTVPGCVNADTKLTLRGLNTGTVVPLPVTFDDAAKCDAKIKTEVKPDRIVAKRTEARIKVQLAAPADSLTPTGNVTVTVNKKTYTGKVNSAGQLTVRLKVFKQPGRYRAVVRYAGDPSYNAAKKTLTLRVKRR